MKIGVVGCGAVGTFYGARLGRSGQETHFLLRSDFEAVSRQGVAVESPWGNFQYAPHCARRPQEVGVCDLVLVALKTTANANFGSLVTPLVGPQTILLTLQNGLGNEEALARLFPATPILGGLCFVCLNRTAPGHIRHIDHGKIVLGEFGQRSGERARAVAELLRGAGVPCDVADDLGRARWEKLVWNIPFNGLGVASAAGWDAVASGRVVPGRPPEPCRTTDRLLGEPRWEGLVRELMNEVVSGARRVGWELSRGLAEKLLERTRTMGAYKPSTVLDFELGRPLELESLFLDPLRQAERAGAALPRLRAVCAVLEGLTRSV